jgi:hypothetical protein
MELEKSFNRPALYFHRGKDELQFNIRARLAAIDILYLNMERSLQHIKLESSILLAEIWHFCGFGEGEYKARKNLLLRNYPQNFWSGHRPSLAG